MPKISLKWPESRIIKVNKKGSLGYVPESLNQKGKGLYDLNI